jgi:hypothetical protein
LPSLASSDGTAEQKNGGNTHFWEILRFSFNRNQYQMSMH